MALWRPGDAARNGRRRSRASRRLRGPRARRAGARRRAAAVQLDGPAVRRHAAGMRGGGGPGQMAHLALLDRDFNEADYEMLLQLDEPDLHDPEKKRR